MPTNPTGTKPQPLPETKSPEEINMKCRMDGCDSITATQMVIPTMPSARRYTCVKCRFSWMVNVGGFIDI